MTMRMRVRAVEHVFIEFTDDIDPESLAGCRDAYDRIPNIGWKNVTVVLNRIACVNDAASALLRHLQSRAGAFEFFLANCGPGISKMIEPAQPARDAARSGESRLVGEGPSRPVRERTVDRARPPEALQEF